ncbi:cytochrome c3 family protein [Leptothrix cholodnii]|uniref:cytochrome c3 family protein n=1 Tax=Leptothrix cholodnii TaxID=34029 RepID=UPI0003216F84|nr:cytochrome c3 family protein [Leptothrix cholodnii]
MACAPVTLPQPGTTSSRAWQALLRLCAVLLLAALAWGLPTPASAQGIESVLAPGKLITGHAKAEADCKSCHVKFDRAAQDGLCTECHKDVGADLRQRAGFHGRKLAEQPQACRTCHTDHKGRNAKIVELDQKAFDHDKLSDFALRGKHVTTECKSCHVAGKKWREAALECNSCHKKDDVHKAALGPKCESCHGESDWKKTTFDHAKTRFALDFKHADASCSDCHKDQRYQDAPRTCIGCHKKDDEQLIKGRRGHQGQYGTKCESCHNAKGWKPSTFNHDADTKYALKGLHKPLECKTCHTGPLYKQKLASDCLSCHKKDDKHKGSLGQNCSSCHNERGWKELGKFDHDKTKFPLLGKHVDTECKACHKSLVYNEAPKDCIGCHKKDDKHEGTLGRACESCHGASDWKTTKGRFDHDKTKFQLRNGHAGPKVECKACHVNLKSYRNTPTDCYSCHKKDDKHEGQQGQRCESCHIDKNWKTLVGFDHAKSRFALTGRHVVTACKDCHTSARFKDAPSDCYSCHKKADKHKLTLGVSCESCHNTRDWALWNFNHDKQTDYRLEGPHRKLACTSCHTREAPRGKATAPVGQACIGCHRKDDVHDGSFGSRCEQCHVVDRWKRVINRGMRGSVDDRLDPGAARGLAGVAEVAETLGQASHAARRFLNPPPSAAMNGRERNPT